MAASFEGIESSLKNTHMHGNSVSEEARANHAFRSPESYTGTVTSLAYRIRRRWAKTRDWFRGLYHGVVTLRWHRWGGRHVRDLTRFQRRIPFIERAEYSQNGEDGIIAAIFALIGTEGKFFVEFGAEDGVQCNTRYLRMRKGWRGLMMDGGHEDPAINLRRAFITAENIEELFRQYGVPETFDLLSIDIDGNDYWVWKAITRFRPRVVVIEYNGCLPCAPAVTIPYRPDFAWDRTDYYGASLAALEKLGREKGYMLVGTDSNGVNAFFVLDELARKFFVPQTAEELYHPAAFKGRAGNRHPPDLLKRPWVQV